MIWPVRPTPLEGEIVPLEAIEEAHRAPLEAISREPETWTWIDRRIPGDRAAFDAWFEARRAATRDGTELCFVTHRAGGGEPLGSSSYLNVRPAHDGLEIGWSWLHPSAWRSGANVEAKLLMLSHAFEELGCMRVEFKTDARNERSRAALAALAALPAIFEGVLRKHMLVPPLGLRDSAYYSIVDDDWPEVGQNLTARLARHVEAPAHA